MNTGNISYAFGVNPIMKSKKMNLINLSKQLDDVLGELTEENYEDMVIWLADWNKIYQKHGGKNAGTFTLYDTMNEFMKKYKIDKNQLKDFVGKMTKQKNGTWVMK